jgi:hypothetical protein
MDHDALLDHEARQHCMLLTCTAASIDTGTSMALVAASSATPTTTSITRLLALHAPSNGH